MRSELCLCVSHYARDLCGVFRYTDNRSGETGTDKFSMICESC